jgi:hypothetical protein
MSLSDERYSIVSGHCFQGAGSLSHRPHADRVNFALFPSIIGLSANNDAQLKRFAFPERFFHSKQRRNMLEAHKKSVVRLI